jgi:CO/xanthine dehydrogenase FAD-binding subunit
MSGLLVGAILRSPHPHARIVSIDTSAAERLPGVHAVIHAARVLGSVQIRTMASVGGNLCHATPSAEMPPALLVHEAVAEVAGCDGTRSLPLGELFAGPGRTSLANSELLTAVRARVPPQPPAPATCARRCAERWTSPGSGSPRRSRSTA